MSQTKFLLTELKSGRLTRAQFLRLMQFSQRSREPYLHPLLERNTSQLSEQRFSTRFTGTEFFLNDHRVEGQAVLPAAAYVEMARAAVQASGAGESRGGWEFEQLLWVSPLVVSEEREVHVGLDAQEDGGWVEYEVYSGAGDQAQVHARGRLRAQESVAASVLELTALQAQSVEELSAEQCYGVFARQGIQYGAGHRALRSVQLCATGAQRSVLARFELPAELGAGAHEYELHPSVLDGALQAVLGLRWGEAESGARVPFAMRRVRVYGPTPRSGYVHVRAQGSGFAIEVCDASGEVSVAIEGLTLLPYKGEAHTAAPSVSTPIASVPSALVQTVVPPPLTLAVRWDPVTPELAKSPWPSAEAAALLVGPEALCRRWQETLPNAIVVAPHKDQSIEALAQTLSAAQPVSHVIWLAPVPDPLLSVDGLIEAQETGLISLFRLVKALLSTGYGARALGLSVITWQTQAVVPDETVHPAHAAVHGMIGSLAKEYTNWKVRLIDSPLECAESSPLPLAEVLRLPADPRGEAWAYRSGEWYRQKLIAVESPLVAREPAYRNGGVYVIIGGAGGLGEVFTEYLIRHYGARVIWVGRRELDDELRAKISRLSQLGVAPVYYRADATDGGALERLREDIKTLYGTIHGIVHAALTLLDKSVAQMTEERFRESTRSKIDTSVRMVAAFGREPLDWILFFSSFQSFVKQAGQSNYAAGCTYVDAFAHWLRRSSATPVKVVNWGYWGSVGVVSSEAHRLLMERQGLGSIEPAEGMRALQEMLSGPIEQLIIVKITRPDVLERLSDTSERIVCLDGRREMNPVALAESAAGEMKPAVLQGSVVTESERMDRLLARLLRIQLDRAHNDRQLQASGPYERWLEESVRILEGADDRGGDAEETWKEWNSWTAQWQGIPSLAARARLAETALRALPDILSGRVKATSVMFPNASLELVEPIYAGNPVADHFNAILADAAVERVARMSPASNLKARILEVGAGTGGTTKVVIEKFKQHAAKIEEYLYTDMSRGFLLHGKQHFGATAGWLKTALLDVERPLAPQHIALGSYDVVIATNVLHATRGIRNTLRNIKAALRPGGVLLINEISTHSLFAHLTFGLLDGWWLFEDPALRMAGTPALAPDSWHRVLRGEGFSCIEFPAHASHGIGQQVIVAESDGVIRQRGSKPQTVTEVTGELLPDPAAAAAAASAQRTGLLPVNAESLFERTLAALRKLVSEALLVAEQELDPEERLDRYGVDSIFVLKVTNILDAYIPGVSSTLFFEHQTLNALARHFVEHERAAVEAWVGAAPEAAQPVDLDLLVSPPARPIESSRSGSAADRAKQPRAATARARRWRPAIAQSAAAGEANAAVADTSIAIIGLAGRYPHARTPDELWNNLTAGRNCVREVPAERWNWREYHSGAKGESGKIYTRWGGFIDGIDQFDPLFFRLLPMQAEQMDPQERLFLQEAYACIEDAGYTPGNLSASKRVGVYVGVMNDTYSHNPRHWSVANRVSFTFDFHGPSIALDTACSSSLTALHLACESLRSGDCDAAIAGGVNLIIAPEHFMALSAMSMLAADERCKSFGSGADGFVDGEGVGAVLLKPLAKAVEAGDHIYGIIRATAINAGGRTNGYTVPNLAAQRDVIRTALSKAKLDARAVSYLEAHGTGTELGDPIELEALSQAFSLARDEQNRYVNRDRQYCAIGSIKSNIGHLESAAGIAGLTKVLLQLKHGQLVASLHSQERNPHIDFGRTPFQVQQSLEEWRRPVMIVDGQEREIPRIAGLSSFGAGGANAHVIVEEYRERSAPAAANALEPNAGHYELVLLSARDPERLHEQVNQLLAKLVGGHYVEGDLPRIAFTLQNGREHMEHRAAFMVRSIEELQRKLTAYTRGGLNATNEEAWFSGDTSQHRTTLSFFNADEDAHHLIETWVAKGKYAKLLELWVKGLTCDWSCLRTADQSSGPLSRRISLPSYPFARDRYWRPRQGLKDSRRDAEGDRLHPLLHRNTSTFVNQSFISQLSREDILAFLPGATVGDSVPLTLLLEMARVAFLLSHDADAYGADVAIVGAGTTFENLRLAPVSIPVAEAVSLQISLQRGDEGSVRFEIVHLEECIRESIGATAQHTVASGTMRVRSSESLAPVNGSELRHRREAGELPTSVTEPCADPATGVRIVYSRRGVDQQGRMRSAGMLEADRTMGERPSLVTLEAALRHFAERRIVQDLPEAAGSAIKIDTLDMVATDGFAARFYAAASPINSPIEGVDLELEDEDGRLLARIRGLVEDCSDNGAATRPMTRSLPEASASSPPDRFIVEHLAAALGLDRNHIDASRSLDDYGMDSVVAAQLARQLEQSFQITIGPRDLLEQGTVERLARHINALRDATSKGDEARERDAAPASFPVRQANERVPLLAAQRSLVLHEQAARRRPIYHVPICLRLRGKLDTVLLRQSLNEIVKRHEALRTTIRRSDGESWQLVHEFLEPEWRELDRRAAPLSNALDAWKDMASVPFDLEAGPLLRAAVIRLEGEFILGVCAHHLVIDGWSVGILIEELLSGYKALSLGEAPARVPLLRQYADYAAWRQRTGNDLATAAEFRRAERLRDVPTLDLALWGEDRPAVQSFEGTSRSLNVPATVTQRIRDASQQNGGSLFGFLVACFELTLARHTGQPRFAIGIPFANRHVPELAPIIGHFASTVPITANVAAADTFAQLQASVRSELALAQQDDSASFEEVLRLIGRRRDARYSPGYQVMCVMQPARVRNQPDDPLLVDIAGTDLGVTLFDAVMQVVEVDERLEIFLTFNRIVGEERMSAMAADLIRLIDLASIRPDQPVTELLSELPLRVISLRLWGSDLEERSAALAAAARRVGLPLRISTGASGESVSSGQHEIASGFHWATPEVDETRLPDIAARCLLRIEPSGDAAATAARAVAQIARLLLEDADAARIEPVLRDVLRRCTDEKSIGGGSLPSMAAAQAVGEGVSSHQAQQSFAHTTGQAEHAQLVETLRQLWSEGLQLPTVGVDDDFILLGGSSLAATQVLNQVRLRFGIDLPLGAIFEAPTVAEFIAKFLSGRTPTPPTSAGYVGGGLVDHGPIAGVYPFGSKIPASDAQIRLAFLDRLEPGSAAYNMPVALRLNGALNVAALESALNTIDERHDALRSAIEIDGGAEDCWQVVMKHLDEVLSIVDLSELAAPEREMKLNVICQQESSQPFDLKRGPLWRRRLVRCGVDDHCLLLTFHHAACDGWSIGVLAREISTLYTNECSGRSITLPPLPVTYADYAVWQRNRQARLAAELDYWRTQLTGAPRLDLPTDRVRSAGKRERGALVRRELAPEQASRLRALVSAQRVTPFMALLSAFALVLHRHSGQQDVIIGSTVAGRITAELEPMVGCFLNTVALRVRSAPEESFTQMLAQVRDTVVAALSHQSCPFERVLEVVHRDPGVSRTPLIQVLFNYLDVPPARLAMAGIEVEATATARLTSKFDLDLTAREERDSIVLELEYDTGLFEEQTAVRVLEHTLALLVVATGTPEASLVELTSHSLGACPPPVLWPVTEAVTLLPFREDPESIADRFRRIVEVHGTAAAVADGSRTLTFAELDAASNQVARRLIAHIGIPAAPARVALLCAHEWRMPIAVLGVLKTGSIYVPLDPRAPDERLQAMLEDAECSAIVCSPALRGRAEILGRAIAGTGDALAVLDLDRVADGCVQDGYVQDGCVDDGCVDDGAACYLAAAATEVRAETPAYILYTSGSTGKPKGVLQTQGNVVAHMSSYVRRIGIGPADQVAMLAGYVFDAGVMDLFGALLSGATLVLVDPRAHAPALLRKALQSCSILHSTPTLFRYLMQESDSGWRPRARVLVLGGEEVRSSDVALFQKRFGTGCRLVNGLGPTECTLALQYCVSDADADRAAIAVGHPVPGVEIVLLDEQGRHAPVRGEIMIRSPYLALGYWRQEELTRKAFSVVDGVRCYRTGDLGQWRADGSLIFAGRKDHQVKVRGHRIELGEIESVLRAHASVGDAVVIADRQADAETRLVAFVTANGSLAIEPQDLLMHLRRRLPEYAVPSMLLPIDALPLTLTGKVDRARLPAVPRTLKNAVLSPPRTATEKAIADIWCEVLGLQTVGRDQNFFDLGGHSLLLARVQSLLMSELGRSVAMADMFAFPTVSALAVALDGGPSKTDEFQVNRARALNRREMLRKRRTEEVQPNE